MTRPHLVTSVHVLADTDETSHWIIGFDTFPAVEAWLTNDMRLQLHVGVAARDISLLQRPAQLEELDAPWAAMVRPFRQTTDAFLSPLTGELTENAFLNPLMGEVTGGDHNFVTWRDSKTNTTHTVRFGTRTPLPANWAVGRLNTALHATFTTPELTTIANRALRALPAIELGTVQDQLRTARAEADRANARVDALTTRRDVLLDTITTGGT